jgi:hypothetical protein
MGRHVLVALTVGLVLAGSGCSDASPDSPPSGIDELTIPTPSPDPSDFVRHIDNPWLPYAAGKIWSYTLRVDDLEYLQSLTVLSDRKQVAGVDTTVVETLVVPSLDGQPHGTPIRTRDYYAQDRRGNVWWFGRDGVWLAGEDGAEAGLAMPATPRLGDGWRAAYDADVVDVQLTVETLDQAVTTPAGRYGHALGLDVTYPLEPGTAKRAFYERGVGLIEEISTEGPISIAELQSPPD